VVGFNLTMPHKPAAFELCDAVGPAATFEGVVNTIRIEGGRRLVGESFDGGGFLNAAREEGVFDPERRCVIIGAGGAGRAIRHALARTGFRRLRILNEAPAPVEALAAKLRAQFPRLDIDFDERFDDAGLLINATCVRPMPCRWTRGGCQAIARCSTSSPHDGRSSWMLPRRGDLKMIDRVAMIRHQLPLQTAFWKGEA
jgi:shikimate dehydrogenase